jgi:hypothetical protein
MGGVTSSKFSRRWHCLLFYLKCVKAYTFSKTVLPINLGLAWRRHVHTALLLTQLHSTKGNDVTSHARYINSFICWRMSSSGTLGCVALVRTGVSVESSVSIVRVTKIGERGTMLAVTSDRCTETSILTRATSRNITEDGILQSHRRENM